MRLRDCLQEKEREKGKNRDPMKTKDIKKKKEGKLKKYRIWAEGCEEKKVRLRDTFI